MGIIQSAQASSPLESRCGSTLPDLHCLIPNKCEGRADCLAKRQVGGARHNDEERSCGSMIYEEEGHHLPKIIASLI